MSEALRQVAELVRRESGIALQEGQLPALRAALRRIGVGLDALGFLRLAADPVAGRAALARLLDEVTVKETSFLRDRRQLDAIAWRLLYEQALAAGDGCVRVWTAACATGEEAWTLALLASEALPQAAGGPPVDVLATDISAAALAHAEAGAYRQRPTRPVDQRLRGRYFEERDGELVVRNALRPLVRFQQHNLARDPLPPLGEGPFDLILCRNVLIYFDGETVERVISGLERSLRPGGTLILGAADALCGTARRVALASATVPSAPRPARRALRRPLGRERREPAVERLARARAAADGGRPEVALEVAEELLADDPLNADAYFLRGLVVLENGRPQEAVESLRRALYVDPLFGLAAFTLGRAYDALGDAQAARRAYEQALRSLDDDDRHEAMLGQIDLGDVAGACRARLAVLR